MAAAGESVEREKERRWRQNSNLKFSFLCIAQSLVNAVNVLKNIHNRHLPNYPRKNMDTFCEIKILPITICVSYLIIVSTIPLHCVTKSMESTLYEL